MNLTEELSEIDVKAARRGLYVVFQIDKGGIWVNVVTAMAPMIVERLSPADPSPV